MRWTLEVVPITWAVRENAVRGTGAEESRYVRNTLEINTGGRGLMLGV